MEKELLQLLQTSINRQLLANGNKNIFIMQERGLHFTPETLHLLEENRPVLVRLCPQDAAVLVQYMSQRLCDVLFENNQYIHINKNEYLEVLELYRLLVEDIQDVLLPFGEIEARHYTRLGKMLQKTNPFLYRRYAGGEEILQPVVCAEYSPAFLMELLGLEPETIKEPILDIGCGRSGALVNHLRGLGLSAYGIDRLQENKDYFQKADWLEYDFGRDKWGTLLANLSFSSHFLHHILQNEPCTRDYSRAYAAMLLSLRPGGRFIYAPSLPLLEEALPAGLWVCRRHAVWGEFCRTTVCRRGG